MTWENEIIAAQQLAEKKGYQPLDFVFEYLGEYGKGATIFVTYKPVGIRRAFPTNFEPYQASWLALYEFDLDWDRFRDVDDSRTHERETRIELMRQSHDQRMRDWELRHDRVMREWEKRYDHTVTNQAEQNKGLLSLASGGIKTLALLHGGAAAAVLQFMHKEKESSNPIPKELGYALECFLLGLFLVLALNIIAYMTQLYFANFFAANKRAQKIGNNALGNRWRAAGVVCAVLSAVAFIVGGEIAINVLLEGKSFLLRPFN